MKQTLISNYFRTNMHSSFFCLYLDDWPERGKKLFKRFRNVTKGIYWEKTNWYMRRDKENI